MLEVILKALALGLFLSLSVGPVFAGLLETSLNKGINQGFLMAIGVNVSDWIYASAIVLGIGSLGIVTSNNEALTYLGGGILILFGLRNLFKKPEQRDEAMLHEDKVPVKGFRRRISSFSKGFFLNFLNPGTPIVWLTASAASAGYRKEYGQPTQLLFIAIILFTIFTFDCLKVYAGKKAAIMAKPLVLLWLNRAIGVFMIAASVSLLWPVLSQRFAAH